MKEIASVILIPPCWLRGHQWYNAETGEYFDPPLPPLPPVYVQIGGRRREAVRWLWLWRIVAWIQQRSIASHFIIGGLGLLFVTLCVLWCI